MSAPVPDAIPGLHIGMAGTDFTVTGLIITIRTGLFTGDRYGIRGGIL